MLCGFEQELKLARGGNRTRSQGFGSRYDLFLKITDFSFFFKIHGLHFLQKIVNNGCFHVIGILISDE